MQQYYQDIVIVGDSYSASGEFTTIKDNASYGAHMAEYFESTLHNVSYPGLSLSAMNRNFYHWGGWNKDKLNSNTLVVVGMTLLDRIERWIGKRFEQHIASGPVENWFLTEPYRDGMENTNFWNACSIVIGLQSFFKSNNMDYIFFDGFSGFDGKTSASYYEDYCYNKSDQSKIPKMIWDSLVDTTYWYEHPKYKSMVDFISDNVDELCVSKSDIHPNKRAHKIWSEKLIKFTNEVM